MKTALIIFEFRNPIFNLKIDLITLIFDFIRKEREKRQLKAENLG